MSFSVTVSWPPATHGSHHTAQNSEPLQREPLAKDSGTGDEKISRDHQLSFASGQVVAGSAAPEYQGSQDKVNPEESLLSALAACHMLSFLTIVEKKRMTLLSYRDEAWAELGRNEKGQMAITRIALTPEVELTPPQREEQLAKLHALAHKHCFIANSLAKEIAIEITPRQRR
ncbi:OsmC family protein [Shewanella alkalitolerans]|uniref:OsmC family protein n=1 Tax=Shewanella alkalitolerans TaxID=2864209 RepID=UPI0021ABD9D1|nr:OsmC family protein [Shewanella alkalitolerans]